MVSTIKSNAKKEFIIRSQGEANFVEVLPHHNLSHVRRLILDEFDEDQLPSQDGFAFRVNGIRVAEKQEEKKCAYDLIEREAVVELVPKGVKRTVSDVNQLEGGEDGNKRAKTEYSCRGVVTPYGSKKMEEENDEQQDVGKESSLKSTISERDDDSTTMMPVDLDGKFVDKKQGDEDGAYFSSSESTVALDWEVTMVGSNESILDDNCKGSGKEEDDVESAYFAKQDLVGDKKSRTNITIPSNQAARESASDDIEGSEDMVSVAFSSSNNSSTDYNKDLVAVRTTDVDADIDVKPATKKGDEEDSEDDGEVVEFPIESNPHKVADEAKDKSKAVLSELKIILKENPNFCSEIRMNELIGDIDDIAKKISPRTTIGVLGNTGTGKSSFLNALLEEASVLPTSGSRGCTAAVVELVFHFDLVKEPQHPDQKVPVYTGEVEFITLEDWRKELKVLIDECSTQENTIYARPPLEENMPDAAAAWQKIEQVYGKKSMEKFHGKPSEHVYKVLSNDARVRKLLTPSGVSREHNSIYVNVGETTVGSEVVTELLKPFARMKGRVRSMRKKWAQDFRSRINDYVYRLGNGDLPQTWPLIHKVKLRGPWHVLSTGACLVDLPGVRDSNAARAKVAERYLQNCNQIAIVASIKRAVDDGTARELMGEQFKRRLLMDGNYGNICFVCTQTDDLEATETMRDHQDVAEHVPGRWEKMSELATKISSIERQINDKLQEKEDLECQIEEAKEEWKESCADLSDADEEDAGLVSNLEAVVSRNKAVWTDSMAALEQWNHSNMSLIKRDQTKCDRLQKKLKAFCAAVRNEYSTSCLQEDFKSGLKELYRKGDDIDETSNTTDPEEFNMDVFCISANDYLKLAKIKPSRDGPPNTFSCASETQIPALMSYIHKTTARFNESSVKSFVEETNDVLDRMKLIAGDIDAVPTGRSAFRMKSIFDVAMQDLATSIEPIALDFTTELDGTINQSLASSLESGALKGGREAMSIVHSWGSSNRRTYAERRPDKNGLYWSTYNAVARRDGVYTSPTVGAIDFNQELCDPMEKEFSTEWQAVLDSLVKRLLQDAENKVLQLCATTCQSLANKLRRIGVDAARLAAMFNTANRSAVSAVKSSFQRMNALAIDSQRELSRELLPSVKEKMKSSYDACVGVETGPGRFARMQGAMAMSSQRAVRDMFHDATASLLKGIKSMVHRLKLMIGSTSDVIVKSIESVFSILWDSNKSEKSTEIVDVEMMKTIRDCRNALLPDLNKLVDIQREACELLGIERGDIELDVMGVESFEQSLERKMEEAEKKGAVYDFCDSDRDDELPVRFNPLTRIKPERNQSSGAKAHPVMTVGASTVIDLCESDDEDDRKPPADSTRAARGNVKVEAWI
ncbi:hypothetical protein HJC23_007356 [Cyclotella cryptica]|uniref:Uncharacterized protein n=1 Tax=Cyclotella cryptica TaxID=29204 RepID=A0ABD3Q3Q2_9STRA|eukprot:CCRYP_008668-RB/>CCRYP_008668-RB protein AED:0.15 eAED:0.15 QI:233/1/1/1/0.55/0.4/10/2538/1375